MLRSRFLWQIWMLFGITLMISSVVFGVLAANQIRNDELDRITTSLLAQANALSPTMNSILLNGNRLTAEDVVGLAPGTLARITLIAKNGTVLADNRTDAITMENHGDRPEVLSAETNPFGQSQRYSQTLGVSMLYLVVKLPDGNGEPGYLRLAVPTTEIEEQVSALYRSLVLGALLTGALFLVLGYMLAYRIARPMSQLTNTAREIARGHFHLRLDEKRLDELGQIAAIINELAAGAELRIEEITQHRNELEAVLAGLKEGVIALDEKGRILHINESAIDILRMPAMNLPGESFSDLPVSREIRQAVQSSILEATDYSSTFNVDRLSIEYSCVVLGKTESGSASGLMVVLEDVTERIRLEEVRSDFVANASHELKTPISAIRGLVETIIDDPSMPKDVSAEFTQRIRNQTVRLDQIVQDLLQLSRFDSSERHKEQQRVDLANVLTQVHQAKLYDAQDAGIELRLDIQDRPLEIEGEAEAIDQLVTNLVDNALKYTGAAGKVQVSLQRTGSMAQVEVKDNGIGIPQDELQRIFERFYRVDRARSRELGGTGLGLAIVKHIARAHHGSVAVTSQVEEGSTFTVTLPLAPGS